MAISTSTALSSYLLPGSSASTTLASAASGSHGDELSAELAAAQKGSGSPLSLPLQDQVTLSVLQADRSQNASTLYNMQGLLEQSNASLMANDPLLQSGQTTSGNSNDASVSDLLALAADESANGAVEASAGGVGNAQWAQALKQNPSLAGLMVGDTLNQGMIDMLA